MTNVSRRCKAKMVESLATAIFALCVVLLLSSGEKPPEVIAAIALFALFALAELVFFFKYRSLKRKIEGEHADAIDISR